MYMFLMTEVRRQVHQINLLINQNFSTYYFDVNPYPWEKIKEENNTTYSKKELLNNLEAVIKNVYKINDIKRII